MEQTEQLVKSIVKGIQEKKGQQIAIVDMRKMDGAVAQYFVICQGSSPTQVDAVADAVEEMARVELGEKPTHVIGREMAQWIAMDYTDVMVHVFLPEARTFYNLENLWEDAPLTLVPDEE
jgi:ribosome-associated protein